jgi:hypothetical protein
MRSGNEASVQLHLNPQLNRGLIREILQRQGPVHSPDLLTADSAAELYSCLSTQTAWQLLLNIGQRHLDLAHEQLLLIPPDRRRFLNGPPFLDFVREVTQVALCDEHDFAVARRLGWHSAAYDRSLT